MGEAMAEQFARRSGIPFIGLRLSNIMEPNDYDRFPSFWDDPSIRKWNLWGYVDVRDVSNAVQAAMESDVPGASIFIVAAADTVMNQPSADLMRQVYPDVPLRRPVPGRETLLAIDRAHGVIGYKPKHTWMDHVS
jgi:nucleoside-diphosphate-sugar epimerase